MLYLENYSKKLIIFEISINIFQKTTQRESSVSRNQMNLQICYPKKKSQKIPSVKTFIENYPEGLTIRHMLRWFQRNYWKLWRDWTDADSEGWSHRMWQDASWKLKSIIRNLFLNVAEGFSDLPENHRSLQCLRCWTFLLQGVIQ